MTASSDEAYHIWILKHKLRKKRHFEYKRKCPQVSRNVKKIIVVSSKKIDIKTYFNALLDKVPVGRVQ